MDPQLKQELVIRALREGIINDPSWKDRLDEPMPAWAVIEIALHLLEKLDSLSGSYD